MLYDMASILYKYTKTFLSILQNQQKMKDIFFFPTLK